MICLARQRADFPVVNPRAEMPVEQSNGFGKPVENRQILVVVATPEV